jgi:hypothetical protein
MAYLSNAKYMKINYDIQINREVLQRSLIFTAITATAIAIIIAFTSWDKAPKSPKEMAFIEVEGIDPPLVLIPDEEPEKVKSSTKVNPADLGNNSSGTGENDPKVSGTPGEASGDESKDPRTPDAKDILNNKDGEVNMPTKGNSRTATRMPDGTVRPPTGSNAQGQARRNVRTLGPLNGIGTGTGGNGDVNNGYGGQGNGGPGGNAGRPDGVPGGKGNLGTKYLSGNDFYEDDINESGKAVFAATFNKSGTCISVSVISSQSTVTNSDQLRKGREAVQKQRVNADANAPDVRTAKFIVNFKKQGG